MRYRYISLIVSILLSINIFAANGTDSLANSSKTGRQDYTKAYLTGNETAEALFNKAEFSYSKKQYSESVAIYESILKKFGPSFEVYYNLGNAFYKSSDYGPAILNYERALRIKPGDRDARFNLELCQTKIVDNIQPVGTFLLTRGYRSLGNNFNSNQWAVLSIVLFAIFIGSLFVYFFSRKLWFKKAGFYTGIISLLLSVVSVVYSAQKYNEIKNPDEAIIISPTVTVKSSPDQSGTDIFIIHEGTKVKVINELSDWKDIKLLDGNEGWIESKNMEII